MNQKILSSKMFVLVRMGEDFHVNNWKTFLNIIPKGFLEIISEKFSWNCLKFFFSKSFRHMGPFYNWILLSIEYRRCFTGSSSTESSSIWAGLRQVIADRCPWLEAPSLKDILHYLWSWMILSRSKHLAKGWQPISSYKWTADGIHF